MYSYLALPPWCIWMKFMCYLFFTLILQLLKSEMWIVQTIFLSANQSSCSVHKLSLAFRVKKWDIINAIQTAESLVANSKWFVCFVQSSEILCVTNNLIFYSFCSILSFIHFVHVSLSEKKTYSGNGKKSHGYCR
jgi:hypothetical protein